MTGPVNPWPDDLVERAVGRDLILIVGSGVSRSCSLPDGLRPPSWEDLLRDLTRKLHLDHRKDEIEALIEKERLLDAAELVRQEARGQGREQDLLTGVRRAVDGPPGSYFEGSGWHEAIVRLESQVIVTTNYDKIIERATNGGYSMHEYGSDRVAGDVRRTVPVLLKIHGNVDNIEDIVLTRTDYTSLQIKGTQALRVLEALLLTRTALLLGYSLRDPDMQLVLENVLGGRGEAPAHYILCSDDLPDYERDMLRFCYGVNAVTHPAGDYSAALAYLDQLADIVQSAPPL